jgi:DnaJ like chaperone protein
LGVSKNVSDREVKQAYRRLISQHHPDKLVSKGLPKEMMDLAKDKTAELTAAYDDIRKRRNMR